ncbi:hypothetical protein GIB67_014304 [Kingdonia uniflora]|uniref:Uncharacterized protein n=1 Tax=Kingdonia uniflora TaxID=39325 RepID=A0A7J7NTS4_9MAGN|nr:hypothetical protein GIB67_014304 [Kingdonia uniflora]
MGSLRYDLFIPILSRTRLIINPRPNLWGLLVSLGTSSGSFRSPIGYSFSFGKPSRMVLPLGTIYGMTMMIGIPTAPAVAQRRRPLLMPCSSVQSSQASGMTLTLRSILVIGVTLTRLILSFTVVTIFPEESLIPPNFAAPLALLCYDSLRAADAKEAEAVAILRGMETALSSGLHRVLLLTDCLRLVRAFRECSEDLSWGALTLAPDIREMAAFFLIFVLNFVIVAGRPCFVVVDMEHGYRGISDALPCLHALAATVTLAILRIPESSVTWAKKALDLGPQGIMFPMIDNAKLVKVVSYGQDRPNYL